MKGFLLALVFIGIHFSLSAQDWSGIPVPANPGEGGSWELVEELSDDFNYEASANDMGATFESKWQDQFFNGWTGPGNTEWTPNNSSVTGGNLEIKATRKSGDIVYFQAVTSKTKIGYPAYIETRMKVMNSVMANAVWMLSDDSSEEIDIVEAYGSSYSESADETRVWFAQRMHLSHHVFDRSNPSDILDYQPPTSSGTYYYDGSYWRDAFRTVGVYWRDSLHLEYFIDGELVRTVSGSAIIDPNNYRDGLGLSQDETLIISGAAQTWQVNNGVWPTDNELAVVEDNIFKIDWIRTYKRIGGGPVPTLTSENELINSLVFSNPVSDNISIRANSGIKQIDFYNLGGILIKSAKNITPANEDISVSELFAGVYIMKVMDYRGGCATEKLIKQ